MSTAATAELAITCPDWCTVTAEDHVADLWNMGGECLHYGPETIVRDTSGIQRPLEAPIMCADVTVHCVTSTNPEGRATASPIIYVNGAELTTLQAAALADVLRSAVATCQAEQ